MRRSTGCPASVAAWSTRASSDWLSIEWMRLKLSVALRALFVCRWPTRCHLRERSEVASIFCSASCTLFSPKSTCPAAAAARTCSGPKVLDTATSRIVAGSRCPRSAARAIRSRTAVSRPAISELAATGGHTGPPLLFQLRDERLRRRRIRPVGGELQVRLELGCCRRQVAFVHQRHAELIVRLRVIRIGLQNRLKL